MKKICLLLIILLCPIVVLAYSRVIPGGETVGIEVKSDGVLVVGFYNIDGIDIGKKAGFTLGDRIISVGEEQINDLSNMMDGLNKCDSICKIKVIRNNKEKDIDLPLTYEDGRIKTGLYVKDSIHGLGTLSFITEDKKFGCLGHEIIESNTLERFPVSDGEIYKGEVINIIKSRDGSAGEKNAYYDRNEVIGDVNTNDSTGIYGIYNGEINETDYMDVGTESDVVLGDAYIRTVIRGTDIDEFSIKIININKKEETKNILFEITDDRLIDSTGGVVQGMSGSPIIQNNKMIGVVNYVLVNDPKKGYGIFVTKMLEKIE